MNQYLGFRRKGRKRLPFGPMIRDAVEFLTREAERMRVVTHEDGPIPGSLMWQYNRWW